MAERYPVPLIINYCALYEEKSQDLNMHDTTDIMLEAYFFLLKRDEYRQIFWGRTISKVCVYLAY